jgi:hypothetical protein
MPAHYPGLHATAHYQLAVQSGFVSLERTAEPMARGVTLGSSLKLYVPTLEHNPGPGFGFSVLFAWTVDTAMLLLSCEITVGRGRDVDSSRLSYAAEVLFMNQHAPVTNQLQ